MHVNLYKLVGVISKPYVLQAFSTKYKSMHRKVCLKWSNYVFVENTDSFSAVWNATVNLSWATSQSETSFPARFEAASLYIQGIYEERCRSKQFISAGSRQSSCQSHLYANQIIIVCRLYASKNRSSRITWQQKFMGNPRGSTLQKWTRLRVLASVFYSGGDMLSGLRHMQSTSWLLSVMDSNAMPPVSCIQTQKNLVLHLL